MRLTDLIAPISKDTFFGEYFEQRHLYCPGQGRDLAPIFRLEDLDYLLAGLGDGGNVKTSGGRGEGTGARGSAGGDLQSLFDAFSNGQTVVVNALQNHWQPVRAMCNALTEDLEMATQCNLYVTPAAAQGFRPHWDGHDVLVLQVHGTKDWTLFDMPAEVPRPDGDGDEVPQPGDSMARITLHPGDVLYVPRGMPHLARSTLGSSVHLTIGLIGLSWEALIKAAAQVIADNRQKMRRVLPQGWSEGALTGGRGLETYKALATALADEDVLQSAVDMLATSLIQGMPGPADGHFAVLDLLDGMTLETRLVRRSGRLARVLGDGDNCMLCFAGGEMRAPVKAMWAFGYFAESHDFHVRDIPGWYSDPERLLLAKGLVRAGMFTIARPDAPDHEPSSTAMAQPVPE